MSEREMSEQGGEPARVIYRTFLGRVLCRESSAEGEKGVLHIIEGDRHSRREIATVGAFVGLWSFAATGCLLPWSGALGPDWLRIMLCLLAWWPAWFLLMQVLTVGSGGMALILERQGVLSPRESRVFAELCACVLLAVLAVFLATEPLLVCQIVGWIWLLALAIEGVGSGLLWLMKLAVVRKA